MPVTILVPNPRSMSQHQISFASVAKTIMTLPFMSKKKTKLHATEDHLGIHLSNLTCLLEFDVKV